MIGLYLSYFSHKLATCHSATTSDVPAMLREMQVVEDADSHSGDLQPTIPLLDQLEYFSHQCIRLDHARGYQEYIFAKDMQTIQRCW
jgi:hypothetical protein